ncbi:MAG: threonylcarbamoyl-AMP synthase, partial [Micrococcaceae bacterium]|nr:threonylcarbamoyl-AMP synthase [Micrococcaceae bacterium]
MTDVSDFIDVSDPAALENAVARAREVLADRGCVVLPTDTVYGIGADAFSPLAVAVLLAAKGRGRTMPPPVLIADRRVMAGLAYDVPEEAEALAERFWPGALTLILKSQPTLTWDLGETRGTVALRMPDDEIALDLLRRTGPLAVSSANRHGKSAALTVLDAATQLGDAVEEYLDGGTARLGTSSTIIDATVVPAEIVREGSLSAEDVVAVV